MYEVANYTKVECTKVKDHLYKYVSYICMYVIFILYYICILLYYIIYVYIYVYYICIYIYVQWKYKNSIIQLESQLTLVYEFTHYSKKMTV